MNMIRTIFRLTFWSVFLAGWGLAALSLHVVRTPSKIGLIPKEHLGFTDTFVDARTWKLSDLSAHPDLVQRVLEADRAELFAYLTDPNRGDAATQIAQAAGQTAPRQSTSMVGKARGLFSSPAVETAVSHTIAGFDTNSLPVVF
jgi:hypothetical protein